MIPIHLKILSSLNEGAHASLADDLIDSSISPDEEYHKFEESR